MATTTKTSDLISVFGNELGKAAVCQHYRGERFMFSVFDLYTNKRKRADLEANGFHAFVGHDAPIMLDSGGYQILRARIKGQHAKADYSIPALASIYKAARLGKDDFAMSLDTPPIWSTPADEALRLIEQNDSQLRQLRSLMPGGVRSRILPVLHGWTRASFKASMDTCRGEPVVGIGAFFGLLANGKLCKELVSKWTIMMDLLHHDPDFKGGAKRFHALGASGANPFHLCVFSGIEQTDSSAWRQQAAFFKLSFVGLPVASVSGKCTTFLAPWRDTHEAALKACECECCKGLSLQERKDLYLLGNELGSSTTEKATGEQARGIHNIHHMIKERELAESMAGTPRHFRYLTERFARSRNLRPFLKASFEARFQPNLTRFIKDTNKEASQP